MTNPTFNVNAAMLCWVHGLRLLREGDERQYLTGILIEPAPQGGVYIVATNGAAMGVAFDAEGTASGRILIDPDEAFIMELPDDHTLGKRAVLDPVSLTLMVEGMLYITTPTVMNAKEYPHWKKLLKRSSDLEPKTGGAYLDSLLLDCLSAGLPYDEPRKRTMQILTPRQGDLMKATHYFHFTGLPYIGILNPVYHETVTKTQPWLADADPEVA